MISTEVRTQLHSIGIFCSDDRAGRHKKTANPFFVIRADSEDPTPEELQVLAEVTKEYREIRFKPSEIVNEFWGELANTILLWKRVDGWRYRRNTWESQHSWAPQSGQSIDMIVEYMFK